MLESTLSEQSHIWRIDNLFIWFTPAVDRNGMENLIDRIFEVKSLKDKKENKDSLINSLTNFLGGYFRFYWTKKANPACKLVIKTLSSEVSAFCIQELPDILPYLIPLWGTVATTSVYATASWDKGNFYLRYKNKERKVLIHFSFSNGVKRHFILSPFEVNPISLLNPLTLARVIEEEKRKEDERKSFEKKRYKGTFQKMVERRVKRQAIELLFGFLFGELEL